MLEPSTHTQKRYAICVGINIYTPSSELKALKFAENDARAIDEVLGTLGFDQGDRALLLGEQATLAAINEALNEMMDRAEENDLVVFYFAGHGVPLYFEKDDTRDVFLASYDFDPQKLEQRRSLRTQHALGMERLRRDYFESQGSRKRLFLFDSCYSGEFAGFRSDDKVAVQQYMHKMLDSNSTGRVALLSCLPEQVAVETSRHGHGRFTYYLLQALQGKAPAALRSDGWLTVNTLFEYLSQQLPEGQRPVLSGIQHDVFELVRYSNLAKSEAEHEYAMHVKLPISEKEVYLRAMLADHTSFLNNRLDSFVGRKQELAEIHRRIQEKVSTGGYVIITGQAGQGKSSIMAKLVEDYGVAQVAFHFIPFNPGPDHQVGLLRNLMARLIIKYQLSEIYVTAESRATLRDYFPNVLREVAAKGGQEVLFIDGLDQIEEDMNGFRDLSFLPTNPPSGIVFVLTTRPDDALRPLVLLKPHEQYQLPNLKREDFDLILQHRNVVIDRHLADQFYLAMEENALYLDLVAKELHDNTGLSHQEMIAHIAHNPDNLFTLSILRFKRQPLEWREVIKPILGVLLAAREPLAFWHLRQILCLEDDRLRDGIMRLGGLLRESGQRCYSLFHLKLQEYLRQDELQPQKDYVFAADEEEQYHDRLVTWCEQGSLNRIWEDTDEVKEQGKRDYARYHYIQHLFAARHYKKLFGVLDEGSCGKAKEQYDLTNRSYIQDLDLGRRAAIQYGKEIDNDITTLPLLWKYTLLRSSLRSQADNYPKNLFQTFLLLHHEKEVLGLVELITKDGERVNVLNLLGLHFAKNANQQESIQMFLRAISVAQVIEDASDRAQALREIAQTLARGQQWARAEEVARGIEDALDRARALSAIAQTLAQGQQWEQAEEMFSQAEEAARGIENAHDRARALSAIAQALAQGQQWERAEEMLSQAEEATRGIEDASDWVQALSAIAQTLAQGQQWERAEEMLSQAEEVARGIEYSDIQADALSAIAQTLAQGQQWARAEEVARGIEDALDRARALSAIAQTLAQGQQWARAEEVARRIEDVFHQVQALSAIAQALAQGQQWERAEEILSQAEEAARGIEDASDWAQALGAIAQTLAQGQQWERAEEMLSQAEEAARGIENAYDRAQALSAIAQALAQGQQWERAEEVARGIEDASYRARALSAIAQTLAQEQQWERAEEVARGIKYSYTQADVLREIAQTLMQGQQRERAEEMLSQAEEVARGIKNASYRAQVLSAIAQTLAQGQQWERAEEMLSQAEEAARGIEDASYRAQVLSAIAQVLVRGQQWARAEEVARGIEDSYTQADVLREIAQALVQEQQWERAEEMLSQAEEVATGIEDALDRAQALGAIAQALVQGQQWERAEEMLSQAEEVARGIENAHDRAQALSAIAQALAQGQQWERAEEMAGGIEDASYRARALQEIAQTLAQQQQWERAEEVARGIKYSYTQADVLREIAQALVQGQQRERAEEMLSQAEEVARGIKNAHDRAQALSAIAQTLAQGQQWERAEEVARGIEDASYRARALSAIAQTLAQGQQWNLLVRLIQRAWLLVETRAYAFQLFPLVHELIKNNSQLGVDLAEKIIQVDTFLYK